MSRTATTALSLLAFLALSACQQLPTQSGQGGEAVRAGAAATAASAAGAAAAPAQAAPSAQAALRPSVEFRLAQPEQAPNLSQLRMANATLWVAPQPVLTRSDLSTVVSVRSKDGKPYVRFAFNESGAQKLAAVTQRFPGKNLVLTVGGNLVATPRIGGPVANGVLFVPMASEQQALNVAAVIGGAGAPAIR
ncbi:hypothetical protein [Cupriavidus sp. AU9028]|uniref:SecDF P1 head subdomain-containing protein n=1 Tax=Cupriavidus sp. AU9028 TaxID=2871157 RepID=UPI001C955C82|nr:hypothetical protein [Cupriavidus sp. AU9028]MBY4896178.1 hypothetical protein [Cupriavidus sp. AU9028]